MDDESEEESPGFLPRKRGRLGVPASNQLEVVPSTSVQHTPPGLTNKFKKTALKTNSIDHRPTAVLIAPPMQKVFSVPVANQATADLLPSCSIKSETRCVKNNQSEEQG